MPLLRSRLLAAAVLAAAVLVPLCWRGGPEVPGAPAAPAALCAFAVAQAGSRVRVKYELRNGDTGEPVEAGSEMDFVLGESEDTAFLDTAVEGLSVGDTKEARFGGEAGFGERNADWVVPYDREMFGDGDLQVGMQLELQGSPGRVVAFNESVVTLDFNHPLAGLNITLVATLVSCEAECEAAARVTVEPVSPGDGATFPKPGDRLRVHCNASYADGDGGFVFSSYEQGQPYEFELGSGKVIRGLEIGIQQVSLGGRATLRIPADLAYGRVSATVQVPVNRDIVFEVELLSIN